MARCPNCHSAEIHYWPEGDVSCSNHEECGGWGGSYIELLDTEGGFADVLPFLSHVGQLEAPRRVRRHAWPDGVYLYNRHGQIVQVGELPGGPLSVLGDQLFARDWHLMPTHE